MKFEEMTVEWKGHAGFFIEDGKKMYIDPYNIGEDNEKADFVLLTHSHYDHCSIEDLRKVIKDGTMVICPADCQSKLTRIDKKIGLEIMAPGQDIEIEGIDIKAVPAYNPEKRFHARDEKWNGYVVKVEGKTIYHSGDTDVIPEMSDLGESTHIDLALLPVRGKYTMNAEEAARAVVLLRPRLSIPMHWGEIVGSREDAEQFVKLCEEEGFEAEVLEKK